MNDSKDASDLFPPKLTREVFNQWFGDEAKKQFITRVQVKECQAEGIPVYCICESNSAYSLSVKVSDKLKQGFQLWGPMTTDQGQLYQAMVKS